MMQLQSIGNFSTKTRRQSELPWDPLPTEASSGCHKFPWWQLPGSPHRQVQAVAHLGWHPLLHSHRIHHLPRSPSLPSSHHHHQPDCIYNTTPGIHHTSLPAPPTMAQLREDQFEDHLPTMAGRLGGQGLLEELCNGFRLLMDPKEGVITLGSLKRNAALMGLEGMGEEELESMMREGDLNGDGVLDQMEFCILMFRMSPELMDESWRVMGRAMEEDLGSC